MSRAAVLTSQVSDFPRWYQDVVAKAQLADNGPVRGTMVIRPYGYAIWERMQAELDARIKDAGAQNAYFPLFIPESYLQREAEHVEGFSPELAVVTHAGGKDLEEPIVVRPTSETIFGEYMAKWVQSYRDLPLLLNQWANVVRWELRPRVFLRTSEFLWQEGHTVHATQADAAAYTRRILHEVYAAMMVDVLAIPVVPGLKTPKERFAGAAHTLTCEAMMRDGKALQMGTSHEMGQNFARAFDIRFLDAEGERPYAWTTSWGASTRMVGGLIMTHGDDSGLRIPPRLAATQAVVTMVKAGEGVAELAGGLVADLRAAGVRVDLDDQVAVAYGRRAVDWELKGVPVRIEIGPRDVSAGTVTVVRRIPGTKTPTPVAEVVAAVGEALSADQAALLREAEAFRDSRTVDATTIDEATEAAGTGWARIPWSAVGEEGEARLAESAMTVRCLLRPDGSVPETEDEPDLIAIVGRSY
ncbi:proline--tRNA ligase [Actinopolymorpha singaporensis]|uniref:Proline--tRNA ligase n=1 Tax=Actinopolymorpha singaporensis TaxID=117157 RepID=A0A1H1L557_9ACTN|nr:proline--tRNA ligase [Actinopolymorpha singaporensis]SDR69049.1 prolyl-tRNA synthetase [Actinopolymorpha singaporensis]